MTSPKKLFIPTIALSLVLGSLNPAFAEHGGIDRLAKKLDLTQQQIAAIGALREERGSQHEARRELNAEIHSLIESGQIDAAATLAGSAASERVYEMAAKRTAMAEILTPEQLAEWDQLKQRRGKRHHGSGRGQHRGEQDYQ